jgi:hypothetical protein
MNALNEFLFKNLNDEDWHIYNAFPDAKIRDRFILTLVSKKNQTIYNELVHRTLVIKKGGYIRGILDPRKGCLRALLYIPTCVSKQQCRDLVDTRSLKDVKIQPQIALRIQQTGHLKLNERASRATLDQKVVQIIRAYIPDRASCNKLYKTEQETKKLKHDLTDSIIYMPAKGVKYKEYISDPDFIKRWRPYDQSI